MMSTRWSMKSLRVDGHVAVELGGLDARDRRDVGLRDAGRHDQRARPRYVVAVWSS